MSHLSPDTLAALAAHRLPAEETAPALAHCRACDACRAEVSRLALGARTLESSDPNRGWTGDLLTPAPPPTPRQSLLQPGDKVGRFEIERFVAEGGMGQVYAARDAHLGRSVALKLLRRVAPVEAEVAAQQERLLREAQVMAQLSHPNVVTVYEAGELAGRVFVAMELVEGGTLRDWLDGGPRSREEILRVFIEAGRGLAAAHAKGLVHRDFKPDNVLLGADGRPRVTDFGLALFLPSPATPPAREPSIFSSPVSSPPARAGGTPAYMAPEQHDAAELDGRADQFSFCAALYEALSGTLPFAGRTIAERRAEARADRVQAPREPVPGWLLEVLRRGLRAQPSERFANMDELLLALGRDPALRRRGFLLGAIMGGLALLALGLSLRGHANVPAACLDPAQRLAGVWDAPREQEIRRAFEATGLAHAPEAFRSVHEALARFAAAWTASIATACQESQRPQESEASTYLRLACLTQQLAEARAKSELFTKADRRLVEDAPGIVSVLGDPARCLHGTGQVVPPLPPRELRPDVERLREELVRARTLSEAGRHPESRTLILAAVPKARALGWTPLVAEALLQLAETEASLYDSERALQTTLDAAFAAEGARHDVVAAKARLLAWKITSSQLSRFEQAPELERNARAAIERLGGDDELLAQAENTRGADLMRAGQLEEALAAQHKARALYETTGRNDRFTTWLLNDEATVLFELDRLDEAVALFARATSIKETLLGPHHADVGISLSNLGSALTSLGHFDDALAALERAHRIFEDTLPPDHPLMIATETNFGDLAAARGDLPAALRWYQQSLHRRENEEPIHQNTRSALVGLGRTLIALGRPAEAIPVLERAIPRDFKAGDALEVTAARFALARALEASGKDLPRARALAEQARVFYGGAGRAGKKGLAEVLAWQSGPAGQRVSGR